MRSATKRRVACDILNLFRANVDHAPIAHAIELFFTGDEHQITIEQAVSWLSYRSCIGGGAEPIPPHRHPSAILARGGEERLIVRQHLGILSQDRLRG